jgi:hypothetical protein
MNVFGCAGTAIIPLRPGRFGAAAGDRPNPDRHAGHDVGLRLARLRSLASCLCRRRVLSSSLGGPRTCAAGPHARSGGVPAAKAGPFSGVARHARAAARGPSALRSPRASSPRRATGSELILSSMRPIQRARGRTRDQGHAAIPPGLSLRSRRDAPGTIPSSRSVVLNAPALAWGARGGAGSRRASMQP